jgi:hypothetical protein
VYRYESAKALDVRPAHTLSYSEQIQNDINRSLWQFEHVRKWKTDKRERRRRVLSDVIHLTLERHSELHYYQGFHDVAAVFVLVCDEASTAFALTERAALAYFADMMRQDFRILMSILKLLMPLLQFADNELFEFLMRSEVQFILCHNMRMVIYVELMIGRTVFLPVRNRYMVLARHQAASNCGTTLRRVSYFASALFSLSFCVGECHL